MCKWKSFEPGFTFKTTCIFTGAQHEHTVVSRDGDRIVCSAVYHECDGTHHVEEAYEVLKAPNGKEYIIVSEYKGEQFVKYADESICCFDACFKCELSECLTGKIAREKGIEAYLEFLEELKIASELEEAEADESETVEESKKLAEFEVKGERYIVYGDYEIQQGSYYDYDNHNKESYDYPEFTSLSAKVVKDGKEIDFTPSGVSWTGHKYDICDMIQDFLAKQIQYSKRYKKVYIDKGLQKMIDWYHSDIAIVYKLLQIPKRVLSVDMYELYKLVLVTSEYIYYMYDDSCLMLDAENHEVVSDNSFASGGYFESVENIKNGKNNETLIWGELPKE